MKNVFGSKTQLGLLSVLIIVFGSACFRNPGASKTPTLLPSAESVEPFYGGASGSYLSLYVKCDSSSDVLDVQYSNGSSQNSQATYNCATGSVAASKTMTIGVSKGLQEVPTIQKITLPVTQGDVAQDFTVSYRKRARTVSSNAVIKKFRYYPFLGDYDIKGVAGKDDPDVDNWLVLSGRNPVVHIGAADGAQQYVVTIFDSRFDESVCGPYTIKSPTTLLSDCALLSDGDYRIKAEAQNFNLQKVALNSGFGFGVDDWNATVGADAIKGIAGGVQSVESDVLEDGPDPTLVWNSIEGAADYEVYFSEDSSLGDPLQKETQFKFNAVPADEVAPPDYTTRDSIYGVVGSSSSSFVGSAVSAMKSLFGFGVSSPTVVRSVTSMSAPSESPNCKKESKEITQIPKGNVGGDIVINNFYQFGANERVLSILVNGKPSKAGNDIKFVTADSLGQETTYYPIFDSELNFEEPDRITKFVSFTINRNSVFTNMTLQIETCASTEPTVAPTTEPTTAPTEVPTVAPTVKPTTAPTGTPTATPTVEPTAEPTTVPTTAPTREPKITPTPFPAFERKGQRAGVTNKVNLSAKLKNETVYYAYLVAKSRSGKIRKPIAKPFKFTVSFPNPSPVPALCDDTTSNPRPTWSWVAGQWKGNGPIGLDTFKVTLDDTDIDSAIDTNSKSFTPSFDLTPGEHILRLKGLSALGNYSDVVECKKIITSSCGPVPTPDPVCDSPVWNSSSCSWTYSACVTPAPEATPGDFTITGVTGPGDRQLNDVLFGSVNPVFNWTASTNAFSYSIIVKDQLGVTKCSTTELSGATSSDITFCNSLSDMTDYTVFVTANSVTGKISVPAANSPFTFSVRAVPPPAGANVLSVTDSNSCAIRSGKIFCWGGTKYAPNPVTGVLESEGGPGYLPLPVKNSDGATMIAGTKGDPAYPLPKQLSFAIIDGGLYSFDFNTVASPAIVPSGVSYVSAGDFGYCAVVEGGVKCWGSIPDPGITKDATQVVVGNGHACALFSSGGVKCWGVGVEGQLGDGLKTSSNTPVQVAGLTSGARSLGLGHGISCAVMLTGELKCWGWIAANEQEINSPTPMTYPGFESGTQSVFGGAVHGCSLRGGDAYCVGFNASGQLGFSKGTTKRTATLVPGLPVGQVSELALSYSHTCAVAADTVYCWGDQTYTQVGNNPNVFTPNTTKTIPDFSGGPSATPTPNPTPVPTPSPTPGPVVRGVTGGSGGSADVVIDNLQTAGANNSPFIHWDSYPTATSYTVRIYSGAVDYCLKTYASPDRTVSCSGLRNFNNYSIEVKAFAPAGTYTYPSFVYRIQN